MGYEKSRHGFLFSYLSFFDARTAPAIRIHIDCLGMELVHRISVADLVVNIHV